MATDLLAPYVESVSSENVLKASTFLTKLGKDFERYDSTPRTCGPEPVMVVLRHLDSVRFLADAFMTYPTFDTAALSLTKKHEAEIEGFQRMFRTRRRRGTGGRRTVRRTVRRNASKRAKAKLFLELPVFAIARYGRGLGFAPEEKLDLAPDRRARFMRGRDDEMFQDIPRRPIPGTELARAKFEHNMGEIEVKSDLFWDDIAATAFAPPVPNRILERVRPLSDQMNLYLCWEAEWSLGRARPQGDPFVLGECEGVYFLLARWNSSTFEEYVAREFTRSPEA